MNLNSPALILMTLNCAAIAGVAAIEGVAAVAAARVRVAKHDPVHLFLKEFGITKKPIISL